MRNYIGFHGATLLTGQASFDTPESFSETPMTCHSFAKPPEDHSTYVQVRLTADGNATPFKVNLGALHNNSIVLQYGADNMVEHVQYVNVL